MKKITTAVVMALTLAACTPKDETPKTDTAAVAAAVPAAPTLESMAGDYTGVTMPEQGDSVTGKWTSHSNPDGTGWVVSEGSKDTVKFTGMMEGENLVLTSAPHTDPAIPKAVGPVTWKAVSKMEGTNITGTIAVSPVSKPDTVIMRMRLQGTRK